jgi:hypothetical protein
MGIGEAGGQRSLVMAAFDRGDVAGVPLDPAFGHEQRGT